MVQYLLSQAANIYADNYEVISLASRSKHLEIVRYLQPLGAAISA